MAARRGTSGAAWWASVTACVLVVPAIALGLYLARHVSLPSRQEAEQELTRQIEQPGDHVVASMACADPVDRVITCLLRDRAGAYGYGTVGVYTTRDSGRRHHRGTGEYLSYDWAFPVPADRAVTLDLALRPGQAGTVNVLVMIELEPALRSVGLPAYFMPGCPAVEVGATVRCPGHDGLPEQQLTRTAEDSYRFSVTMPAPA